ncbi:MAG: preprotein translocase subunit YajC [Microbacteriaceae bacterium]|nr:preprotein translocase subunit YajC [Microbacteriaceae bacterium]
MNPTIALSLLDADPAETPASTAGTLFGFDPLTIGLFALLAVVVFMMFRSSRKRRRDQEELQTKMVPGAEIMTQTGIFGTLVSIDEETNQAIIETTPGTRLRVHRQVLARVVEPDEIPADDAPAESTGDPEFGERTDETKPKRNPRQKPTE